ncbi:MAG: DUF2061 domain-containing protein [Candidatus Omnitrophica bacterium]|nr:DUF2061 domain-containing protein [Candidatus Omnitrophota bacterium]
MAIEQRWRSLTKAASWRITGTLDTMIVSWIITRQVKVAISIGCVEVFTKMILYYFHERAWNKINAGRAKEDYQI